MSSKNNKYTRIFDEFLRILNGGKSNKKEFSRLISNGSSGEIRDIFYKGKPALAKVTEKKKERIYEEKLRGPNIVKIHKILTKTYDGTDYNFIIMEKMVLKDLATMSNFVHNNNFYKLINEPFYELIGDNFVRFFAKQIIKGLLTLEMNELVHFDIKPENILIHHGLTLKITDFNYLTNLEEYSDPTKKLTIPETTPGYVTPDFFKSKEVDKDTAKKQDYFALGATLFYFKIGYQMLKYRKLEEDKLTEDRVIDILQRDIAHIRSNPLFDPKFVDFICDLITYIPSERLTFEEIYRNMWLNKNSDDASTVINAFSDGEEDKFMKELVKSDFYLEKQKQIDKEVPNKANFTFVE